LIDERFLKCWNAVTYSTDTYQDDCNGMWMREVCWENYRAVHECGHLTALFLKLHTLNILPVA
jgi:hypothetical protein